MGHDQAAVRERPATACTGRCTATANGAGWPRWAREQLEQAVRIAAGAPDGLGTARLLHREWFSPVAAERSRPRRCRPIVQALRASRASSAHEVVGTDGWWRTWGHAWTPPHVRRESVRVLLTPYPDQLDTVVRRVTAFLRDTDVSWALACATDARRAYRAGSTVLELPSADDLPEGLLEAIGPALRPVVAPLSLPIAPGAGLVHPARTGMTFGEHRCHLIALALRTRGAAPGSGDPLDAIRAVFAAHGIRAATPYRTGTGVRSELMNSPSYPAVRAS